MILPIPHPWGAPIVRPCAVVQLDSAHRLWIVAPFRDEPPPPQPPGPTPRLWEHEVVELFVGTAAHPTGPYLEVEIGPHGHHLVLRLRGVRDVIEQGLPLAVRTTRADGWWAGVATLDPAWFPTPPWVALACHASAPHDARAHRTSVPLPGPAPDFHQPAAWPTVPPPGDPDPERVLALSGATDTAVAHWLHAAVAADASARV